MDAFLSQATVYFGAAVIAVPIAARLGLRLVLSQLACGIPVTPILWLVASGTEPCSTSPSSPW